MRCEKSASSPRLSGSSGVGVASLSLPIGVACWPATRAVRVPSEPSVTSAPGGTSIGPPPSDSTVSPLEVRSWPSAFTSKLPLRV